MIFLGRGVRTPCFIAGSAYGAFSGLEYNFGVSGTYQIVVRVFHMHEDKNASNFDTASHKTPDGINILKDSLIYIFL